jgi:hypothetical protein
MRGLAAIGALARPFKGLINLKKLAYLAFEGIITT